MEFTTFASGEAFLRDARPLIDSDPVVGSMIWGLALRYPTAESAVAGDVFFATVRDGADSPVLMALMTPPQRLNLYAAPSCRPETFAFLASLLKQIGVVPPGVLAPRATALGMAGAWQALTGAGRGRSVDIRLYSLTEVTPLPAVPGRPTRAGTEDQALAAEWIGLFSAEAVEAVTAEEAGKIAARKLKGGEIYFWIDGEPVAMAGRARPTPESVSVGAVYTPKALRRRGYARALVAELSRALLAEGFRYVTLYTDLANPTSNKIYREIGFQPRADILELDFTFS